MLGAIAGDVIGSVFEYAGTKTKDFPLLGAGSSLTDDTVMTIAVAVAIMDGAGFAETLRHYGRRYPLADYGGMFARWLRDPSMGPYGSWGNGSAMRVSPVGLAFESTEEVLDQARRSAEVTHDHPEGIRGAEAVALAVFLASRGAEKAEIRRRVTEHSGYALDRSIDELRPAYSFTESCALTVPPALRCFLEGESFEDTVRLAVSLGGDADTLACIAGSIAAPFYGGVPEPLATEVRGRLPAELLEQVDRFAERHPRRS
jgi:ADP-ribosylglycohydrolase